MDGSETPKRKRALAITLGLSLVIPAWVGLFSAGVPTLYCPMPTMTVVPAFLLADRLETSGLAPLELQTAVVLIPILIPTILFFLWNPGLTFRQQSKIPKRTVGLAGLLSILTILDFVLEWKYGLQYQGTHYTIAVDTTNLLWLAVLWCLVIVAWRRQSFWANLLCHWVLFAWLGWYAFPYLGELP
jgi:hypothetical protein